MAQEVEKFLVQQLVAQARAYETLLQLDDFAKRVDPSVRCHLAGLLERVRDACGPWLIHQMRHRSDSGYESFSATWALRSRRRGRTSGGQCFSKLRANLRMRRSMNRSRSQGTPR